jgi:hypothetical protein
MKDRQQAGLAPRKCDNCGLIFTPYRAHQVGCSRACTKALADQIEPTIPVLYTCRECGESHTGYTRGGGGGRFLYCPTCKPIATARNKAAKNDARRLSTAGSPEAVKAKNRRSNLRRYGLTADQYDAMLEKQNGVCLLCADPPKGEGHGASSRLHVDHDHETGKVRALLCNNCNRAIGHFRDDPELMQRASLYVWQHRQT